MSDGGYQRIVVKFGTSVLTSGTPRLHRPQMVNLARQCADLHHRGRKLILVTSGAIAAGRERLSHPAPSPTLAHKQMLAAVGQTYLMALWEQMFTIYGVHVGQMLLTRADVERRGRYLNARATLHTLLENQIIPIINENDAVATEEIRVGDNDNLSALVATLAEADLLILLTDQPGLYTADPRTNPTAELIAEVQTIDETLRRLAGGSVSGLGVGGMVTKLQAAATARLAGVDVIIASGQTPDVILRATEGEPLGTRFPATQSHLESRKKWILAGPRPQGCLCVDNGAKTALQERGRSLLPAGIIQVEGQFQRGDTVTIQAADGRELARGLVQYSSDDLRRLAGQQSEAIEAILGYTYGAAAVHRNDLLLL
ncbi:MAG: glutamate 5-kinase [Anaerolineae bacterium]|nr:glutamate 5-kinase [Anaerolineae bacterium]